MSREDGRVSRRRLLCQSARVFGGAVLGSPLLMRGSPPETSANSRLNLAVVGCGGQGRGVMGWMLGTGEFQLVALCDPDAAQIAAARSSAGDAGAAAKAFEDYRRLLDEAASFDAVLIATPDHWHVPLCKAFLAAN